MSNQLISTSTLVSLLIFLLHSTTTFCQSPVAQSPAPPGPTNITAVLEKAGQYTILIHLMKATQVADQINTQLNNSNQGLTLFAPTDNAFSNLKSGTLNSLTDQQKVSLVQFHILPTLFSISQFQTVSNPLRTQAGDTTSGQFPLNVTTAGNQVNITTGVVNTTVANTIYSDNQLVVYQVDKVLLPLNIFGAVSSSPAPAPALSKGKAKRAKATSSDAPAGSDDNSPADSSGSRGVIRYELSFIALAVFSPWL